MAGPSTWNDLITQINAILDNFAESVGEDVVSSNVIDVTDFTKATGAYVNSPTDPWRVGTIPLIETNSVRGGISGIWYKGPKLTKDSFTGGTVVMFSGSNVVDNLCRVFIDYDKTSKAYSVNIQLGFTGDVPVIDGPVQMTLLSVYPDSGDVIPPAKMTLTSIEGDLVAPAQMTITQVI